MNIRTAKWAASMLLAILTASSNVAVSQENGKETPLKGFPEATITTLPVTENITGPADKLRVGTFDSRALAVAYARSETFRHYLEGLMAEYEKAKAAGDETRVKELDAEGPALQDLLHKQGFSTWPVDNILEQINGKIPEIAKQAEVDVIVSKWDIVYQRSGVEFIDVTDLMVKPFDPDEETLKTIIELRKQDPVALEELEEH